MGASKAEPSKLRRYTKRAGIAVGGVLALVVLLVAGALFSLRFAKVRGYVVSRVNDALSGMFRGKLVIHDLASVGLTGISGANATVFDPAGRRVIDAYGLEAHLSVPTIVWAALTEKSQPLTIRITSASLGYVDVSLVDNGTGVPTLADAFLPRTPSPSSTGPGTVVIIERAAIARAWTHGALASTPPLDVELRDALASLRTDAVSTAIGLEKAGLRARGLPQAVDPVGDVRGSLEIPAAVDKPLGARAHYQGTAAQVPIVLDASYLESKLVATLEAPSVPPEAIVKQVPGLELRSPATLAASAEGVLPKLHGSFALGVGSGKVDGDFDLSLQDDLTVKTNVRTQDLNPADLNRAAPASSLDMNVHAALLVPKSGPMTGNFELTSQPSEIAAQALPGIAVKGTFANDAKTRATRLEAHADVAEPGAQTALDATLVLGKKTVVEFRTSTQLHNPPRLKALAGVSRASGNLGTQGSYGVDDQYLNARVQGEVRDVKQGNNVIGRGKVDGAIRGLLPHPNADVRVDVADATLGGQQVSQARLAARGSLSRLAVTGDVVTRAPERHLQLSTIVSNDRGVLVDHPSVNLRQGDTNLQISADTLQIIDGRTKVSGLRLEGAGSAEVSLLYGSRLESIHARTHDLDLARLLRLVDPNTPLKTGTASITATYEREPGGVRATVSARSHDLTFDRVKGGSFDADLDLQRDVLNGSAHADLKQLGQLSVDFQELHGIDIDHPDASRATGKIALEGRVRLKDLAELIPKEVELPIDRALGTIEYDAAIERARVSTGLPTFHVHVRTKHLQLAGKRESKTTLNTRAEARAAAPASIKGIDFDVDLKHAQSGETALAASVSDALGRLVAVSVEGKATPRLATAAAELAQEWRELPLDVKVSVPPRDLQKLPVELRPAGLSGILSADFSYQGTMNAPRLSLSGKVQHFRETDAKAAPLELQWQGEYDGNRGKVTGRARGGDRDVATADIDFETALNAWLNRVGGATPALDANAHLDFDAFPIGLVPAARTSQVEGALTGKVAIEHFGKDATVDAKLEVRSLKLAQSELGKILTEVTVRGGKADAKLSVEGKRGTTTAEAHSGMDWGARFVPEVRIPADASLHARELRLAAFAPLATSIMGDLDGRLNGDLNAHFRGGAPALDGQIDLQDGVVQLASVGQRFDQISARISLEPGKAKLEQLEARATSGRLKVTGEARFAGLALTGADAHLRIAKNERVSLALNGIEIGETYGAVDIKLRPGDGKGSQELSVDIPQLHVRMPDTGSQDVQDLDPAKGVRVGTHQRDGEFVTLPLQPLKEGDPAKNESPMVVNVNLGDQISIEQGDSTKIQLAGRLQLVLGDPLTMSGQINLKGGKVDVSGKQFEIESGFVTFSGEPANPSIVATARWDSPDDERHRVYVDATGSAKKIKITLRSEPPLTQDQILSLILTGTADGTLGGGSGSNGGTASTAVGAVGGVATQGINNALSSISDLDVSTRIDTSTGSARPELVIQLSARVSAQITRALGDPAPGQPPDLTFLTLTFRVLRNWSLSTLVGDRGESGVDLVWRKRY